MRRRGRAESKEETRRLILEAAAARFLEHGFHASSLEQIADEAGFSTGAVYSNFGGKAELALEVVEDLYTRETQNVLEALARAADSSIDSWFVTIGEWAQQTIGDPAWARLELELAGAMSAREELRTAMAQRYARLREQLIGVISVASSRLGAAARMDPDAAGTLMLGLILGVALQRAVAPDVSGAVIARGLRSIAMDERTEL
ncbi:AcrR family transcriptional regulator [Rhodococcus sp. 27YEA15]|uniref:TetR/AcrR family transcriptional regulator n=1 Tax=Rhodococcus sp. 27YEA15 TaxID=3156259 RepID=UPI003C7A12D3